MDRRTFLQATAVPLGAGALSTLAPEPLDARPKTAAGPTPSASPGGQRPSVVVIGGGTFGVWTALHLRERGHAVTLIDTYGPGSSRATSGDETRQLRVGYGDRELYARMAQRAFAAWRAREAEFGVPLMVETGRLELAPDWTPSLRATHTMLGKLGVPVEALSPDELRRRWPQINVDGMGVGLLEPTAAVLRAKSSIIAAASAFGRKGGRLVVQRATPGRAEGRRLVDVALTSGERVSAERFVFACGPWLPKVFPQLLGGKIKVPGREVFYFGVPAGDTRFNVGS
ncbi:MAG TPA: FAD-dependent oxidoreductase, partial [Gemmatimonadaceae bacterium]|nr:FAD-dependent oxidoreductase [Gemmatimonadaceae bacterium]